MMEQLLQAAKRLAATLKDKGYTGSFLTDGGYPDDPEKSLSKFIREATVRDTNKIQGGFLMETYLTWDGEDKERIQAGFHVAFRNGAFEISGMDIEQKNRYNITVTSCSVDTLSTATLPGCSEAIAKVRPPAQNRNRSRGFRFILLCWLIAMLPCSDLFAQATKWKEWFRQKKTQKEYLVMQIAALQAYIQVAKRGYEIAKTGLTTIGNIKDGDFNLHRDFFSSLENVNPAVKNSAKVADIIAMQVEIVRAYRGDFRGLERGGMMSAEELDYLSGVYKRLLEGCEKLVDELILLTTNGSLEMKDDERIRRIDALYEEMQKNKAFCHVFGSEAKLLAAQRQQELQETENTKLWNGLE